MPKKNKIALVHCVHHKPWLIMSTLISTIVQDFQDFDIYFLYNKGSGEIYYDNFKDLYDEYDKLKRLHGKNTHLDDPFEERLLDVCQINRGNYFEIEYDDDHGLDSGAWYKFIESGLWKGYDYTFFMGEGTLLTGSTVLGDTFDFAEKNNVHFVTGSHEKRYMSRDYAFEKFVSGNVNDPTEMQKFHQRMINKTYEIFSRDSDFKETISKWSPDGDPPQEHHIPNIWGEYGLIIEKIINRLPFTRPIVDGFERGYNSLLIWSRNLGFFHYDLVKKRSPNIFCAGRMVDLNKCVNYTQQGNTKFHTPNDIGWYGGHCNHFVSKELLEKMSKKLEENNIYDAKKLPFAASALETIWGLVPEWLGYKIYFFDGIHRIRKNFISYDREDNQLGMSRYINRYYMGEVSVKPSKNGLVINSMLTSLKDRFLNLNDKYFNR